MRPARRTRKTGWLCALGLMLVGCGNLKEPAQLRIAEIETTLAAASDAAKYVPDQLQHVQEELGELQAQYDKQDYAAVVSGCPTVLHDAQGLAAAARLAKVALMKTLNEQWSRLSATLPGELTDVQHRIEMLGRKSSKKLAAGIDLDAAKVRLADASSVWSKAQAAFAGDNLREAVSTANSVATKLQSLGASLQLNFGSAS